MHRSPTLRMRTVLVEFPWKVYSLWEMEANNYGTMTKFGLQTMNDKKRRGGYRTQSCQMEAKYRKF